MVGKIFCSVVKQVKQLIVGTAILSLGGDNGFFKKLWYNTSATKIEPHSMTPSVSSHLPENLGISVTNSSFKSFHAFSGIDLH